MTINFVVDNETRHIVPAGKYIIMREDQYTELLYVLTGSALPNRMSIETYDYVNIIRKVII